MSGAIPWYVVGEYVSTNDILAVHRVKQALRVASKGLDMIMMGDLNERLGDPCGELKEDLATEVVDRGRVNTTDHFMPQQRYRVSESCTWCMQQEGR